MTRHPLQVFVCSRYPSAVNVYHNVYTSISNCVLIHINFFSRADLRSIITTRKFSMPTPEGIRFPRTRIGLCPCSSDHTRVTKPLPHTKQRLAAFSSSCAIQLRAGSGTHCGVGVSRSGGSRALRLQEMHVRTIGVARMNDVILQRAEADEHNKKHSELGTYPIYDRLGKSPLSPRETAPEHDRPGTSRWDRTRPRWVDHSPRGVGSSVSRTVLVLRM